MLARDNPKRPLLSEVRTEWTTLLSMLPFLLGFGFITSLASSFFLLCARRFETLTFVGAIIVCSVSSLFTLFLRLKNRGSAQFSSFPPCFLLVEVLTYFLLTTAIISPTFVWIALPFAYSSRSSSMLWPWIIRKALGRIITTSRIGRAEELTLYHGSSSGQWNGTVTVKRSDDDNLGLVSHPDNLRRHGDSH
jgi:hypothetical protein